MNRLVLFFLLLALTTGYALWRGDRDSRIAASLCLVAVVISRMVANPVIHRFSTVEPGIVAVDLAAFIGFTLIALGSSRFWPMWVAGLQLTTLIGHALKAIDWALLPRAYGAALVIWSYPILLIVMIGAYREHCRHLADDTAAPPPI